MCIGGLAEGYTLVRNTGGLLDSREHRFQPLDLHRNRSRHCPAKVFIAARNDFEIRVQAHLREHLALNLG